eukprot:CAMPEP_0196665894 /NCGR_PEP_ID=MMETSP1086-20130531/62946_1 /TAXON_ID=77921 /ORGANISM="Cyanoptyche  gloeocystis , Strain SAG4.97" /LENGTH=451 /DNA_ID=CAMNT_0042002873 /DNA_START=42 /DNA_END=1397 /DNA_ORIENTATION=+
MSPIYVDLRVTVSYPSLLQAVAQEMWEKISEVPFDCLCGVPYTALPFATCISVNQNKPMVVRRKEVKNYGTAKAIEGNFSKGQVCMIVEDLVTSGMSVFETVEPLEHEGLVVRDVVVLLDREQGARAHLTSKNLALHSVFTITEVLQVLHGEGRLHEHMLKATLDFIHDNQTALPPAASTPVPSPAASLAPALDKPQRLSFSERAALCTNATAKMLFEIMAAKQSNLCVAADLWTAAEVLTVAAELGPYMCCLKTHADALDQWTPEVAAQLTALAAEHKFLIFEDRKFADIGNTVVMQYQGGPLRIASWSHMTNAHIIPGPGIIDGLKQVGLPLGRGLLLLAQMSSAGSLATGSYTEAAVAMARVNRDFVIGFIAQQQLTADAPWLVHMTPGVKLAAGGDALGQKWDTPHSAIAVRRSDVIIVGRGILDAKDRVAEAKAYQQAAWDAYTKS